LLFLVMRFAMNEPISSSEFPRKKIKFALPELYTIAKSDSMSSTDNPVICKCVVSYLALDGDTGARVRTR
jgi:hypothetical protein